jgi:hypothetical protein
MRDMQGEGERMQQWENIYGRETRQEMHDGGGVEVEVCHEK